MLLRRIIPLAIAILALACEPSVPFDTSKNPSTVDFAAFDPTGSPPDIPLPNDLALQPQAIATQNDAQAALLSQWAVQGFPNDQEVPITIDFVRETLDPATGKPTRTAPALDVTSISPNTLLVLSLSTSGPAVVAYDAPQPADYAVNGDHGTLTLHKSPDPTTKSRRWPAGTTMVVAARGGPNGIKVTNGAAGGLQPQPAMFLLLQDVDLTLPENLALIPGNTRDEKRATAAQLETLRKQYLLPFAAIDATGKFNHKEIATMSTFRVASTTKATHVETDPSAGLMPLPSDFLFGPNGHLLPELAAPTGPFGALGAGLATLDGFSTTAMILMQTSATIDATTVNKDSVFLYEIGSTGSAPTATRLVDLVEALTASKQARFVAEPSAITTTSGGHTGSGAIGLQPAVPAQVPGGPLVAIPPLKEGTTYLVLITDKVKDLNGDPLTRSTLGKILLLDPSLSVSANGKSKIQGVTDVQAAGIDQMRGAIKLGAGTLAAEKGAAYSLDHIAMAYTFKTQTMKNTAVQLAGLPYSTPTSTVTPTVVTTTTGAGIASLMSAYGLDATVPFGNIGTIVEATIVTFNKLQCNAGDTTCADSGAFTPANVNPVAEPINALVAVPKAPFGTCIPGTTAAVCNIPLVVFRHGLGGGRGQMLGIADRLNFAGIAVAAIDAPKHGDRSFCDPSNTTTPQCAAGSTCTPIAALANEGDAAGAGPGQCTSGGSPGAFARHAAIGPCTGCTLSKGVPNASSNFLVTGNLFRTRDSLRQDIIDESQLIRVLSPNPFCTPTAPPTDTAHTCANAVFTSATGAQIDPGKIWFVGQSLGAISGTVDVAANARVAKAALNVGGGTIVDVFTNSSLSPALNAVLASIGIAPGTPAFLQFVQVSKWILDPADPLNFAQNLGIVTLPSFIPNAPPVAPRPVVSQLALCDDTVPNPFNLELYTVAGLGPNGTTGTGTVTTFVNGGTACPANAVAHGFLLAWPLYSVGGANITQQAQDDIAAFFNAGTLPPVSRSH